MRPTWTRASRPPRRGGAPTGSAPSSEARFVLRSRSSTGPRFPRRLRSTRRSVSRSVTRPTRAPSSSMASSAAFSARRRPRSDRPPCPGAGPAMEPEPPSSLRLVTSAEDSLARAEELLAKLEAARERLESTDDPNQAIEVLQELADLAKQIEAELHTARQAAEADAADA